MIIGHERYCSLKEQGLF
nr:hypothetical protein [Paenibacillus algicola]